MSSEADVATTAAASAPNDFGGGVHAGEGHKPVDVNIGGLVRNLLGSPLLSSSLVLPKNSQTLSIKDVRCSH